ncbi:MAG: galactose-1-phosphate uridylyltransferase [bacterium]
MKFPELRQDITNRSWVIIAPSRSKKPSDFEKKNQIKEKIQPQYSSDCPFCLGNEKQDENREVIRIGNKKNWKIRILKNKFPALEEKGKRIWKVNGIKRLMLGIGIHEVIVETPYHNLTLATMTQNHVKEILKAYLLRSSQIAKDKRIEQIIIFKNHKEMAGASLIHSHSQIIATPIIPFQTKIYLEESARYFDNTGECIFCKIIKDELKEKIRIVLENKSFVSLVPYGASSPFHLWIIPKKHNASFLKITSNEINDLSSILKNTLAKLYFGLNDPAYNYVLCSSPIDILKSDSLHWYINIVARVTKIAGFEIGSGMFINPIPPEESADFLRKVKIDKG